jgi:hypothetical protein
MSLRGDGPQKKGAVSPGGRKNKKKKIEALAERLGEDGWWQVHSVGDPSERCPWEWARLKLTADPQKGMNRWLLARRSSEDPDDLIFYQAYGLRIHPSRNWPGSASIAGP